MTDTVAATCLAVAFDATAICTRDAGHTGSHVCTAPDGEISVWSDRDPETWQDVLDDIAGAFNGPVNVYPETEKP